MSQVPAMFARRQPRVQHVTRREFPLQLSMGPISERSSRKLGTKTFLIHVHVHSV